MLTLVIVKLAVVLLTPFAVVYYIVRSVGLNGSVIRGIARQLLLDAVRLFPEEASRARLEEEWLAEMDSISGWFSATCFAIGIRTSAARAAREASRLAVHTAESQADVLGARLHQRLKRVADKSLPLARQAVAIGSKFFEWLV